MSFTRFFPKENNRPVLLPYIILLWIGFISIRIYESQTIELYDLKNGVKGSYITGGICLDLFLTLIITGIYSLLHLVLFSRFKKNCTWFFHFLGLTSIFINIGLVEYFCLAKVPLDRSVFMYSVNELIVISGIENRLNLPFFLIIIGIPAFYFLLGSLLKKCTFSRRTPYPFIAFISIIALGLSKYVLYQNPQKKTIEVLINNKLVYFADESFDYLTTKESDEPVSMSEFKNLDPDFLSSSNVSQTYPLMHSLPDTSVLDKYLNIGRDKPTIVYIIVESLSSDMVGIKADKTGHLMPFMDSVSNNSLYFPNAFSTCDRTHNALPAILASLPNPPKGILTQEMQLPDHWSLINLLKDEYNSRFYCGVELGFNGMQKFMNYHQTDFLSNHYNSNYSKTFDGLKNTWGYPDEALFGQSFYDLKKAKRKSQPRLDVFLTISTHEPYLYPNSSSYQKRVVRKIGKNPQLDYISRSAKDYGAFTYLDDQLRAYFKKASKLPDYENTIFVITGDHGTKLCSFDVLSRFKVPILIYSPLLKKSRRFDNVVTHLDITPTIYNFLRLHYLPNLPKKVPFIGFELDTRKGFHSNRSLVWNVLPLHNSSIFSNGSALMDDGASLIKVNNHLEPIPFKDLKQQQELKKQLAYYEKFSYYAFIHNRILPPLIYKHYTESERWILYRFFKSSPNDKNITDCLNLGSLHIIPKSTKKIRIETEIEIYCSRESDINKAPDLYVSLDNMEGEKRIFLFFQSIHPKFQKKFKKNAWNKLTYSFELNKKDYPNLSAQHDLNFYLFNQAKLDKTKIRLFKTKISVLK